MQLQLLKINVQGRLESASKLRGWKDGVGLRSPTTTNLPTEKPP